MIRDAQGANETARPNDFELARLRAALPEYFDRDGGFMLDRLQQTLRNGDVNLTREGYELKFLGKSYAKYLTSTRTETVVVPDLEHNGEPTNADSENLYIVGDNLDALKHLLGSYAGQVKCIYIDPPYNTGSDGFVYVDDFGFTAKDLVEKVGLDEDEAERVMALQGKSSHSAWLTFMYPRLELAKELLTDDGVIFVSIDDNEQANLKALCDEVFGEQNFQAMISVVSNPGGRDYKQVAIQHEYVLMYGVTDSVLVREIAKEASFPFHDSIGGYELRELRNRNPKFHRGNRPNLYFPFYADPDSITPEGYVSVSLTRTSTHHVEIYPRNSEGRESCWRWGTEKVAANLVDSNPIDSQVVARQKRDGGWNVYEKNRRSTTKVKSVWADTGMRTEDGTRQVRSLFGGTYFDHPKPLALVERCLEVGTDDDSIVLDFFSGSATTADAVMRLNAKDGGSRRFILVQIPDQLSSTDVAYGAGYRSIDEIGRDRIVKAGFAVRSESGADIDYGFRHFRLEEPSERTLDQLQSFDPNEDGVMFAGDFVSKFASNGTPGDQVALSTWLVQDGFGLTAEVNGVELDEYTLSVCGDSGYVVKPGLDSEDVMALVAKLEAGELNLKRLVVFGYSVPFSVMHELKQNLTSLRSGQTVSVIERY